MVQKGSLPFPPGDSAEMGEREARTPFSGLKRIGWRLDQRPKAEARQSDRRVLAFPVYLARPFPKS